MSYAKIVLMTVLDIVPVLLKAQTKYSKSRHL